MADVLLLETPFFSQTGTDDVRDYVQSKYNLALLALGSYLREQSDISVRLINMVKDRVSEQHLVASLRSAPPKIVGLPLYSYNLSSSYRVIKRIRKEFPDTHICCGGPHVSIFPKETLRLPEVDSIVLGDGEEPFLQLCTEVLQSGHLPSARKPPGTYTKEDADRDAMCFKGHSHGDLDKLPVPDLTLLGDFKRYRDFLSDRIMGILTTSRGCPYVCHYCWSEKSKYRMFSVERVIEIMRHYKEMGVEYIEFWDETFNPNKKRIADFADALLQANLGLTWSIRGAVVNHVAPETMRKLKDTGLRIIQFGVESTNEDTLRYLNKKIDLDQIKQAMQVCRESGIRSVANMMANIPGQSRAQIQADFDLLRELSPTYVSVSIYNWAPGTTHYEQAVKDGKITDFWRDHARNPLAEDPLVHAENDVSIEQVYKMRDRFLLKYYFNPSYLLRYLGYIDYTELKRGVEIGGGMLVSLMKRQFQLKPTFQ